MTSDQERFNKQVDIVLGFKKRLAAADLLTKNELGGMFSLISDWCVDSQRLNWLETQVLAIAPLKISKEPNVFTPQFHWTVANTVCRTDGAASFRGAIDDSTAKQRAYDQCPSPYRVLY